MTLDAGRSDAIRTRAFRAAVVFGLAGALSGCGALSPLASRSAAFSSAATAAVAQTTNAYQLVNQAHFDAQVATLVATYDATGFDQNAIKPFLPEEDLKVRTQVLAGLEQYATLLAEVSGNQPIKELETQASAAGDALMKLKEDDFKGLKIDAQEKNLAVTAVAAMGSVLIEHERSRALPGILDKMDPPIQKICAILESDIGTAGKPGLASALHRDYDSQIEAQKKFIRDNAATMSPEQKRTEIELLPRLVQAQQQSDRALAATSRSLAALASAHAALTETKNQKDSPAFRLKLTELVENVQAMNGYYLSLHSK